MKNVAGGVPTVFHSPFLSPRLNRTTICPGIVPQPFGRCSLKLYLTNDLFQTLLTAGIINFVVDSFDGQTEGCLYPNKRRYKVYNDRRSLPSKADTLLRRLKEVEEEREKKKEREREQASMRRGGGTLSFFLTKLQNFETQTSKKKVMKNLLPQKV